MNAVSSKQTVDLTSSFSLSSKNGITFNLWSNYMATRSSWGVYTYTYMSLSQQLLSNGLD